MPPLCGLVLSGGRSIRMGRDKGSLVYSSGIDQRARGLELLRPFCEEVFVSCRREQEVLLPAGMPRILDELADSGPAAGILAARAARETAWLVLACDFPYAEASTVADLVAARSGSHAATVYLNEQGVLEPLFAIWEPEALRALSEDVDRGFKSPLRTLSRLAVRSLSARAPGALRNVND